MAVLGCDQGLGGLCATGDAGHQPRRQNIGEVLHEFESAEARGLRRFDDRGIAGRQGGCQGPGHQKDRKVEGQDVNRHAVGFVAAVLKGPLLGRAGDLAGFVPRHLRIVAVDGRHVVELPHRLRIGLAHLQGHEFGNVMKIAAFDAIGKAV